VAFEGKDRAEVDPSHSGMIGNECADEEAKKAAREGSSPMASSLSHAEAAY